MKRILLFLLLLLNFAYGYANDLSADMFTFDEEKIYSEFEELTKLETLIIENPTMPITDIQALYSNSTTDYLNLNSEYYLSTSENMKYFWTAFAISAVGTFFIYSAVAGPITVAVIYFTTNKDIEKTKKAAWGCAAGTLLGAGIKYAVSSM